MFAHYIVILHLDMDSEPGLSKVVLPLIHQDTVVKHATVMY